MTLQTGNANKDEHWLAQAVEQAGLARGGTLTVPIGTKTVEAWEMVMQQTGAREVDLVEAAARYFRLEVADLMQAEPQTLRLVPETVARRCLIYPLREDDRWLVIATADPTTPDLEKILWFASGRKAVPEVAAPAAIAEAIDRHYSHDHAMEGILKAVDAAVSDGVAVVENTGSESVTAQEAMAAPVARLTNLIIKEAVQQRASDVHIEPGYGAGQVRFRIDGVMRQFMALPMSALNRVVSRIKILGELDIADRLRPQDGRTQVRLKDRVYDLRISTIPTRDAEKAVLRILDTEQSLGLDDLQLPLLEVNHIRKILRHRDGIFVVTGPTGSGKTTTLYAALRELTTGTVNIMTVEDPVEYELEGITQIQVEPKRGVTFASALRAILRQDPDIILVGEIRDLETAEIAIQASMTGHLVLVTLHANDALSTISRLHDLGLDRRFIAESMRGAVAQRLARRVCPECAEPLAAGELNDHEAALAERYGATARVRAHGCEQCGKTGYRGRVAIVEVVTVTPALLQLIGQGADSVALERCALSSGFRPMHIVARDHLEAGLTTVEEIDRVLGDTSEPVSTAEEKPHVLVVDDDGVIRTMARTLLEKNGFRVTEAGNGKYALERIEAEPFDLIVLDLDMPLVPGTAVLERVRGSVATAGLPVVVLTGSERSETEVEMMDRGADDYIRKPIDPPRFVARVKAALRRAAG